MKSIVMMFGLLLAGAEPRAFAADWIVDPSASRLEFIASYENTPAPGVFRTFDTRMRFDPDHLGESRIDVTIAVTSVDMRSTDVNKVILEPEWFDGADFPEAEFHAADVRRSGVNRYIASGILNLKGIQRPVEVPFAWTVAGDRATMEGDLRIQRALFGIGVGEWASARVIGADVAVKFRLSLRKHA